MGQSVDAQIDEAAALAVDQQPLWLQAAAVIVQQIKQAPLGLADGDGSVHHAFDQRVELGFRREAGGDVEEARQGVLHAAHRHR